MGLWAVIASCMSLLWLGSRGLIPRCVLIFQQRGQDRATAGPRMRAPLIVSFRQLAKLTDWFKPERRLRGKVSNCKRTINRCMEAIFNQTPTLGRIEGQFLGRDPFIGYCKEEGSRRTINSKFRAELKSLFSIEPLSLLCFDENSTAQ